MGETGCDIWGKGGGRTLHIRLTRLDGRFLLGVSPRLERLHKRGRGQFHIAFPFAAQIHPRDGAAQLTDDRHGPFLERFIRRSLRLLD